MTATDPSIELMRLINGYQVSQALHAAATLGVADQLKDGPKSYDTVAQACGAHPRSLYRLLRALAAVGVFHESGNKEFSLTPLESVRKHQAGLQSFRSMRRIEASRRNASALRLRFSQSLASLRQRLSQAKVRSTTQRRGSTTNPLVRSERLTISVSS